jgi:hypothetical protein
MKGMVRWRSVITDKKAMVSVTDKYNKRTCYLARIWLVMVDEGAWTQMLVDNTFPNKEVSQQPAVKMIMIR